MSTHKRKKRETTQLFDLMFKYILQEASNPAKVHLINGLFDKAFPPDTPVTFQGTESVSAQPDKLEKTQADSIVMIGDLGFLVEVQIGNDETIALRLFDYGYSYGRKTSRLSPDGSTMTVILPEPGVIFLEPTSTTPDRVVLQLKRQNGEFFEYDAAVCKLLDQSLEEAERRGLLLLLPFYLLRHRQAVKQATGSVVRRELAARTGALVKQAEDILNRGIDRGILTAQDGTMLLERMDQMYTELYRPYKEFQEECMRLQERLKTKWQDYLQEGIQLGEARGRQEGEQRGIQLGKREGEEQGARKAQQEIFALLEQGYSLSQVKAMVSHK